MKKLTTLMAVGAATAIALAFTGAPKVAQAAPCGGAILCACGDTVIADTVLTGNLTCAGTKGLIIFADGITLDLGGFTVTGTAAPFAHGIENAGNQISDPAPGGFDGVTVRNGTVVGFEQGIRAAKVDSFAIEHVTVTGQTSSNAIDILDSEDVKILNTVVFIASGAPATVEAIRLESVIGATVANVAVNGGNVGVNFACGVCDGTEPPTTGQIKNSTFANNGNGILLANTTDAKVTENVVTNSAGSSILVGLGFLAGFPSITKVEISKNVVTGGGSNGILLVQTSDSKVAENMVSANVGDGIRLLAGLVTGSTGNEISKNTSTGNGGFDLRHDGGSTPNIWKENVCVTKSGADIPAC